MIADDDRHLLVLYGTQTGTAHEVAERIGREAKRRWFRVRVLSFEQYQWHELPIEKLVIFVVSTTGQGEVPDMMKPFWRFILQKKLTADSLQNLNFTVFGLGDSSYQNFNFVGKKLHRRLLNLGATSIHRRGDADDQHRLGLDGELTPWMQELWQVLLGMFPLPPGKEIRPENVLPPPRYHLQMGSQQDIANRKNHINYVSSGITDNNNAKQTFNYRHRYYAKVVDNQRLTASDWTQDVRLITLDLGSSGITYAPGDVVNILPGNLDKNVDEFFQLVAIDPNVIVRDFSPADEDTLAVDIPSLPCTVRELIANYYDIYGTPKHRFVFEMLSYFASADHEKERLQYFGSAEGQEDLRDYNHKEHRTLIQILRDFPSVKIPLEYLFEVIPRIQPRSFSICSSLSAHPHQIQVTMAVVEFKTRYGRTRQGVCSSWLASLQPQQSDIYVPIWIQKGTMTLPKDPSRGIIMVGPGTGLAAFRAFLEERKYLKQQGVNVGPTVFFFGCRHKEKDYLHQAEWESYAADGTLSHFFPAFSRDQPQKIYVQHKIKENAAILWDIISQGGFIYVSGSSNRMPKDVRDAFVEVFQKAGQMNPEDAENYMKQLERDRRYQSETWA